MAKKSRSRIRKIDSEEEEGEQAGEYVNSSQGVSRRRITRAKVVAALFAYNTRTRVITLIGKLEPLRRTRKSS